MEGIAIGGRQTECNFAFSSCIQLGNFLFEVILRLCEEINMNHILTAQHKPKNHFLEKAHDLRVTFSSTSEPAKTLNLSFFLRSVIHVKRAKTWKTIM